eukprot:7563989-Ditylum_brightwellii.AAC.1
MQQVWKKIRHGNKKHIDSLIPTLQIPITWPSTSSDEQSTTKLDNPKTATYWQTVNTPKEVAIYLKLRNQLYFGQAKGTPFTLPPLSEEFDWSANSKQSKLVLEGKYSNPELTFLQNLLLQHCKREQDAYLIDHQITIEEFKDKI